MEGGGRKRCCFKEWEPGQLQTDGSLITSNAFQYSTEKNERVETHGDFKLTIGSFLGSNLFVKVLMKDS